MSLSKWIAAFLLLFASPAAVIAQEQHGTVQLDAGPIRGKEEDGVRAYQGIPFAAPPVGELRWKPPQPVAAWTKVKDCTLPGPSCPQPKQSSQGVYSEDCLYLNVWTRAANPKDRLPVMVWIHGGAFNFGSGSLPEYDGKHLAKKGVVVVTFNYRLGPLGFLVHPLLDKESGTSGNYGLLDQIAALKWVQRNIAAFGGDPSCVTIFGQSAGSRSVSLHMISPLSAGLFHRAIAQSGGPILGSEYLSLAFNGDMANVSRMGLKLAARLGCDKGKDVLAALRATSAQEIVKGADCKTSLFDDEALFFAPVFDGWVLPKDPYVAYSSGRQHDVPLIVGSTLNEGTLYLADETNLTIGKYHSFLSSRFGSHLAKALEVFPAHSSSDVASAIDKIVTVAGNAQPARFVAQSMAKKKSLAYVYHFTRLPDTAMARKLKVHHGVELAYVFGNQSKADGYVDADTKLSTSMMGYWVNFARTGSPNGKGLPDWPAYKGDSDLNLEFGDAIRVHKNLYKKECDFIAGLPPYPSE